MPNTIRNARTNRFVPHTLVDAIDGTNSPPGAMWMLKDLVPAPNMDRVFVPRPAAIEQTTFSSFTTPTGVTEMITVGNMVYGFVSSSDFAGKDVPFVYNLSTKTYVTVSGESSGLLPATQPTTGDWTPPTAQQVGSRIVFTHPGFSGTGQGVVPNFAQFIGNYTNASPTITTGPINGLQIGSRIIGSNSGVGATISAVTPTTVQTTATGTTGTPTLTVGSATGLFLGMAVQLSDGSVSSLYVTNIVGTTVTLSGNISGNPSGVTAFFYGTTITASVNSTGTTTGSPIVAVGGGEAVNFGWLDMSGYNVTSLANIPLNGVPVLTGNFPISGGVQPGMTVTGSGIPAGTLVTATQNVVIDAGGTTTTGSPTVDIVPTSAQIEGGFAPAVGQLIAGAGIPTGAKVLAVSYASWPVVALTMSVNATATTTVGIPITLTGSIIILNQNVPAEANNVSITIAGGTAAAPLWGAGDTTFTPLVAKPNWVQEFSGRAYYGVAPTNATPGTTFSDSGLPCQQSSVVNQTLTFNDGIASTCAAGLQLENQLGGIVQSLIVFQGQANVRQITGDIATSNLSMNTLNVAAGTIAPRSLASSPLGLFYAASDGLRYIDFSGTIQGPIGDNGVGICLPFINAVNPTRAAAAYNENIYRITLTWQPPPSAVPQWGAAQRTDEFWLHLNKQRWTGPHSFTTSAIAPWQANNSFVAVPLSVPASLWRADPVPTNGSVYTENGRAMTWAFGTAYLPDNPDGMAVCVSEGTMFFQLPTADDALMTVTDDEGQKLDELYVWQGPQTTAAQRSLLFHNPLIFRQMGISLTGNSSAAVQLGALALNYEMLSYRYTIQVGNPFELGQSILGGPDVARP